MRILIVDDDPRLARSLMRLLSGAGHETSGAITYHAALQLFAECAWDVVIVDKNLPDGDGIDLLPVLAESRPSPAVLVLSGELGLPDVMRIKGLRTLWSPKLGCEKSIVDAVDQLVLMTPDRIVDRCCELRGVTGRKRELITSALTRPRERDKATAGRLGISADTVREYWRRLFGDFQVNSKREVITMIFVFVFRQFLRDKIHW